MPVVRIEKRSCLLSFRVKSLGVKSNKVLANIVGRAGFGKATKLPPVTEKPSAVSKDDVQRDTTTAFETTAAYSQQSKDKTVRDLKDQLTIMDAKIEKLRLKGQGLASDAKAI